MPFMRCLISECFENHLSNLTDDCESRYSHSSIFQYFKLYNLHIPIVDVLLRAWYEHFLNYHSLHETGEGYTFHFIFFQSFYCHIVSSWPGLLFGRDIPLWLRFHTARSCHIHFSHFIRLVLVAIIVSWALWFSPLLKMWWIALSLMLRIIGQTDFIVFWHLVNK